MLDRTTSLTLVLLLGGAAVLAVLNLGMPPSSPVHVPSYVVGLVGKYLCFAILALAIDLVWGFAGILSLGHAAFFALGGYAMGMYLMRQIGTRGVYGNPELPDFMVFLGWKELPWYWYGFDWFGFALLMVVLVPGLLALVFGWLTFRSRVTGVYLSIITQALTYALMLAFFRNDMGFGGNNGLTDFKDILGFPVQADATRVALLVISAIVLAGVVPDRAISDRFAVRQGADCGSRRRSAHAVPRLPPGIVQAFCVCAVGGDGRDRRRALCAAGRHYQSGRVLAGQLDRGGDLGGGRRPRHARGRDCRRGIGQFRQNLVHQRVARVVAIRARRVVHRRDAVPAARADGTARAARPSGAGRTGTGACRSARRCAR